MKTTPRYEVKKHISRITACNAYSLPPYFRSTVCHLSSSALGRASSSQASLALSIVMGSDSYRNQGQEKDDVVRGKGNSVNYTFRMHDPRIGRFFAVDPLVDKYPFYSPYQFSGNQVISTFELEGLEPNEELNGVNLMTADPRGTYVDPNYASNNIDPLTNLFDWKVIVQNNSYRWELLGEHNVEEFEPFVVEAKRIAQPIIKTGTQKMIDNAWNEGRYGKYLQYWASDWDSNLKGEKGFRTVADKGGSVGKVLEATRLPIVSQVGAGLDLISLSVATYYDYKEKEVKEASVNLAVKLLMKVVSGKANGAIDKLGGTEINKEGGKLGSTIILDNTEQLILDSVNDK